LDSWNQAKERERCIDTCTIGFQVMRMIACLDFQSILLSVGLSAESSLETFIVDLYQIQ